MFTANCRRVALVEEKQAGAVGAWLQGSDGNGWEILQPTDLSERQRRLHAKFIYAGYLRSGCLSKGWLYLGSGNLSRRGLLSHGEMAEGRVLEERVPVLISGLGNPLGVVQQAHDQGVVVMSLVGNVRQAKRLEAAGVDVIIASGCDGGGHVGTVGTAALVPQVVDAVTVPVVAGGGLSDGRSLVAALAWGACGIWLGTRFIATQEARAHHNYKDKLVAIDEEGTIVTRAHSGKPVRMVRNTFTATWAGREAEIKPYPWQLLEVGLPASIAGRIEGDVENGVLPAGQGAGLIADVPSAGEVVARIVQQAESLLARLASAAGA
jgi:enoyl-[acyl-carrier protein] reductase II